MKSSRKQSSVLTAAMALVMAAVGISSADAQSASFTGSFAQNFDLALTNSATALPPGFTSMVIAGGNSTYTAASPITTAGIASATADTQTLIVWNAGAKVASSGTQSFNIGCWDTLNDRALGTDPTGTAAQVIQLGLTNNTGSTLYGVTFSYSCKCLTNGSAGTEESELPGYSFFYSTTGTNSAAYWSEVGYAGTVNDPGGVPAIHGLCLPNYTQGTTMTSGPVNILFNTPLTNKGVMYFRWADDNNEANSPDQELAIDDISVVTYTPSGPQAAITSPTNGASFTPGANITVTASATDLASTVTNVNFYSGSTLLGSLTNAPYSLTLTNPALGSYPLTVVAMDQAGLSATSAVVNVTVAYLPPSVSLTSPASGSSFSTPATITLTAAAADSDGTVTNVAFYAGSTLLTNVAAAPYTYVWSGAAAGSYNLTALAMDNNGATATSSVVSITITNPLVASFTGVYTQNFDQALANSSTVLPAGFQPMYLPGSHFTYTNAPGLLLDSNAIATATIGSGAGTLVVWNAGSPVTDASYQCFNVGSWDSLTDRALGTDPTGTGGTVIQLALTNNTGAAIYGVNFSYTEKCLTNGSTSNGSYTDDGTERLELPGYEFFYSITGDSNATNWFQNYQLGATNWVQGTQSNAGPVTLMFANPLTNGGVMYFRWADDNCVASSPDQMYAIDNISITSLYNGPVVNLTSPTNNENYAPGSGQPIIIAATATDSQNAITNVQFFIGGSAIPITPTVSGSNYTIVIPAAYVGTEVPLGAYALTAVAYDVGGLTATSAVVNVTVAYAPPVVSLTSPTNGSSYPALSTVALSATAAASESTVTITNVNFFAGSNLLASVASAPYTYAWANVTAGYYNLTAVASDSAGLSATSSVVAITVTNGYGLPVAAITSPANNAAFATGGNITIVANASEGGGSITNVEFFANSTDLGGATASPYSLTWSNVATGTYSLTVVATDANGVQVTSAAVNVTVSTVHVPPTVALSSPTNGATVNVAAGLYLSASAASASGTITNVAFYQNGFFVANVSTAPYVYLWTNAPSGLYTVKAVATDNTGSSTTSAAVSLIASNSTQIATIQQIKTVFIIPLENHDLVQADPTGSPEQVLGNPAAPYFNSLITAGNSNAAQVSWATHYYSCAINGEHPSEPNYVWSEAGTDFGVRTDNDPAAGNNQWTGVQHLSGQLTAAGVAWKTYQEDVQYSSSELVSASGSGVPVNPYNGTTEYNYAVKHNPMAFFTDTQNKNVYPLTNFWSDLTNNNLGRYNWITPDQYNEMHSSLPSGYTYHGTAWTGDQAAIAEGDNFLSIVIPKIMASAAYTNNGAIIIWTDETESTDDTNTTLPYVIISPLCKGNAYASTLPYSHSSDLKTMDELFGLAYQTNAIPNYLDAQNTGINYVNGSSAVIYDLSDFFTAPRPTTVAGTAVQNGTGTFQLSFSGAVGQTYQVFATTNLALPQASWPVVATGTFTGTNVTFSDTNAPYLKGRYFIVKSP